MCHSQRAKSQLYCLGVFSPILLDKHLEVFIVFLGFLQMGIQEKGTFLQLSKKVAGNVYSGTLKVPAILSIFIILTGNVTTSSLFIRACHSLTHNDTVVSRRRDEPSKLWRVVLLARASVAATCSLNHISLSPNTCTPVRKSVHEVQAHAERGLCMSSWKSECGWESNVCVIRLPEP